MPASLSADASTVSILVVSCMSTFWASAGEAPAASISLAFDSEFFFAGERTSSVSVMPFFPVRVWMNFGGTDEELLGVSPMLCRDCYLLPEILLKGIPGMVWPF